MSARNRGRGNQSQDADEERRLWKEIQAKADEVDKMVTRSNEIGLVIVQVETEQAALLDSGKVGDVSLDERLEKLYRENVKITEEVQHIIQGQSHDMNLLDSLKVLAALRESSEETAAAAQLQASQSQRAANGKVGRGPKKAASKSAAAAVAAAATSEEIDETPAAPSPRISIGSAANRLAVKDKSSRAGSLPATRETSVKIEDGAESVASSADGASSVATGPTTTSKLSNGGRMNRLVLRMGEIVFCRHDLKNFDPKKGDVPEGEGILCRVTNVIGDGKQRRYEVQDADTSDNPPPPQRASVSQLIQIPESNKGLSELPKGKGVLAQYPDTTTFYKAEVFELWRDRATPELVKLNFQDDDNFREVERRFVLTEK